MDDCLHAKDNQCRAVDSCSLFLCVFQSFLDFNIAQTLAYTKDSRQHLITLWLVSHEGRIHVTTHAQTHTRRIAQNRYIDSYNMHSSFDSDWPSNAHFGFSLITWITSATGKLNICAAAMQLHELMGNFHPKWETKSIGAIGCLLQLYNVIRIICRHYQRLSFMNQWPYTWTYNFNRSRAVSRWRSIQNFFFVTKSAIIRDKNELEIDEKRKSRNIRKSAYMSHAAVYRWMSKTNALR